MYWEYLKYIIKHKFFVFVECCKLGIPWLGIIHDWSKFTPKEFFPYANHFFGKGSKGIKTGRDSTGYYRPGDTGKQAFDLAWFYHQKRNKHHWQWWVEVEDYGNKAVKMPIKYRKEMLADWRGAGRAQGTPDTKAWYDKNSHRLILEKETRKWIEERL